VANLITKDGVTPGAVASALVAALESVTEVPILSDSQEEIEIFLGEARRFSIEAEGLEMLFTEKFEDRQDSAVQFLVRNFNSAHMFQGDLASRVVNALVIIGLCGFGRLNRDSSETDLLFRDQMGLQDATQYLALMSSLLGASASHEIISVERLLAGTPNETILAHALRQIFKENGISFRPHERTNQLSGMRNFGGKSRAEAILGRYPFLMLSENRVLSFGQCFVRGSISTKLLTKCQALARTKYGNPDNKYSRDFLSKRFEEFFKELCQIWNPLLHIDEFDYSSRSGDGKSADRIVFEKFKGKEYVTLFQLKCRVPTDDAVFGKTTNGIDEEIERSAAKCISASVKFLVRL
jgi:hypothetical protein